MGQLEITETVQPEEIAGTFDVSLLQSTPTSSSPPLIEGSFVNDGRESHRYQFGSKAPMWPTTSYGPAQTLILESPEAVEKDDYDGDCWQSYTDGFVLMATEVSLDSGERISNRLSVWNNGSDACYPSGEYNFSFGVSLLRDGSDGRTNDRFGFSLSIK